MARLKYNCLNNLKLYEHLFSGKKVLVKIRSQLFSHRKGTRGKKRKSLSFCSGNGYKRIKSIRAHYLTPGRGIGKVSWTVAPEIQIGNGVQSRVVDARRSAHKFALGRPFLAALIGLFDTDRRQDQPKLVGKRSVGQRRRVQEGLGRRGVQSRTTRVPDRNRDLLANQIHEFYNFVTTEWKGFKVLIVLTEL